MAHSSPFHGLNALIETYGMIPPGSTVLCACSGGADSVYLLHRLYLLRERMGFRLAAAHYNHQLRGEESQRDEDFVVQWCQKRGIPLVVGRGDVAQEAQEQGKGAGGGIPAGRSIRPPLRRPVVRPRPGGRT